MPTRTYCPRCHYPSRTCICDAVKTVDSEQRVFILQHPKETNHTKNTVRLVSLCLPTAEVLIGEKPEDFASLQEQVTRSPGHYNVLYPHQHSQSFEQHFRMPPRANFIFIDATWRKAFKMWQLNSWLHQCPSWHFSRPPPSRYDIRHTRIEGGISTLEAVAYVLHKGFGEDTTPLLMAFEAMQSKQLMYRPHNRN